MVPVLDKNKRPLMPCSEKRAKKLMESNKAKPYWCKGIFCIILQEEPKSRYMQDIAIGIDPGSKFNGYTVKSEAHTLINLQTSSIDYVKRKMTDRLLLRSRRRQRNAPYRKCRFNRSAKRDIPPSTKARWQQHLNIIKWMQKLYKINHVVIEDVKAISKKGAKKWNKNFSPIEVGKNWLYDNIKNIGMALYKKCGFDTYNERIELGLKKNTKKSKKDFYSHCVDSWVLVNMYIGGHISVENTRIIFLKPMMFHRRKLHLTTPANGGIRRRYGGTISNGIKKGTLVKYKDVGLFFVGGNSGGRIRLHRLEDNIRLNKSVNKCDLKLLTNMKYSITTESNNYKCADLKTLNNTQAFIKTKIII